MDSSEISIHEGNTGPRFLVPALGLLTGVFLAADLVTLEGQNPVSQFMQFAGVGMLLLSIVAPRKGMYVLIIACGYLDLVKRIAYFYGGGDESLQYDILSFAPLTLAGIFLGIMLPRIAIKKRFLYKHEILVAGLSVGIIVVSFLIGYRNTQSVLKAVTITVAVGTYTLLLLIVPELFKTRLQIEAVLEHIFFIFLPCALWGIYQGIFGYPLIDRVWLASPLTMNGRLLVDVKARAFGTLASPHPFTVVYWMIVIGLYLVWTRSKRRVLILASLAIYFVAFFYAYTRSTWVTFAMTLVAVFFFQKPKRTVFLYGVVIVIFALLVINAENINLDALQRYLPMTTATEEMSLRLGTFSDRLISFHNWSTDPKYWTLFGRTDIFEVESASRSWDERVHDQIGQILTTSGIVGLAASLAVMIGGLHYFHKITWRIPDPKRRRLSIVLLAMVSILLYFASVAGSSLYVFPWNCLFWFVVGCLLSLCGPERAEKAPAKAGGEPLPAKMPRGLDLDAGLGMGLGLPAKSFERAKAPVRPFGNGRGC